MSEGDDQTVLVIDDDPDVRQALAEGLAERGWIVVAEPNGQSALDHLKQGLVPCAILLDLMMPIMDGWQFRDLLRRDKALAAIPVLVISAFSPKPPAGLPDLGDAPFIPKPFEIETVVRAIKRVCSEHSHLPS